MSLSIFFIFRKVSHSLYFIPKRLITFTTNHNLLWLKYNEGRAVGVPLSGVKNVDDLLVAFRKKESPRFDNVPVGDLSLHKNPNEDALRPSFPIEKLSAELEGRNSDENPLVVKIFDHSSITSKTIFIRDIDENCRPLQTFTEVLVENDSDLRDIYENKGSALYQLSEPKKRITKYKQLKNNEKYGVFSRYEQSFNNEVRWHQMEDKAMEEEVYLAMKDYLHLNLGSTVTDMPKNVIGNDGKIVQEWDAVFRVNDILYLCEAKHVMSIDKVPLILERTKTFKERFQSHVQEEFSGVNRVVGVACATYFPPLVRKKAHELGLVCVYPSGWRYRVVDVRSSKYTPDKFKIDY